MDHKESPSHLASIAYRMATDRQFAAELQQHLPVANFEAVQQLSPGELCALQIFLSKRYSLENLCAAVETSPTDVRWWTG